MLALKRKVKQSAILGIRRLLFAWLCLTSVKCLLFFSTIGKSLLKQKSANPMKSSLGVCFTGQFCRLELRNKVERFLAPSMGTYDVHAHFVLQEAREEGCKYSNYQAHVKEDTSSLTVSESFGSIANVRDWFDSYFNSSTTEGSRGATLVGLSVSFSAANFSEPVIRHRYLYTLNKVGMVDEIKRAESHWRQWRSYVECIRRLDSFQQFDLYVRLREDLLFYDNFVPPQVWLKDTKVDIWVPRCTSWGGLNDKLAVIHPRAREAYFEGIHDAYVNHYNDIDCDSKTSCRYRFKTNNPETFQKQALKSLKVRFKEETPETLPCVTGVYTGGTRFCFYQHRRQLGYGLECLPAKERERFTPPCHEFHIEHPKYNY